MTLLLRQALHVLMVLAASGAAARAELLDATLTHAELRRQFAELRAAKTNIDALLEWQFEFSAADSRRLEALSVRLVGDGYRIVSLLATPQSRARLRVARLEQHTPATLERRNRQLREIATQYSGAAYEGAEPPAVH